MLFYARIIQCERTTLYVFQLQTQTLLLKYITSSMKTLSHTPSSNVRYIAFAMRKNASRSHCTARNLQSFHQTFLFDIVSVTRLMLFPAVE